jgi:hypothetical protein
MLVPLYNLSSSLLTYERPPEGFRGVLRACGGFKPQPYWDKKLRALGVDLEAVQI